MNKADSYYIKNLNDILENGFFDENPRPKYKDGTPAYSKFITGVYETYDISKGEFPITTLRNTAIKTGISEILWIYQKQSNCLKLAKEMGINWWNEWEVSDNNIGQRYGATIKRYDLVNNLLKSLKEDPFSRRHIIDMYQYSDLNETVGLFPCAFMTMWSVRKYNNIYYLDMTLIQRSNDYVMAGYINKIQYVALQMMVAGHLGYEVGLFNHLTQNLHIYDRHFNAVTELLNRKALDIEPTIKLKQNKNFYEYDVNDFQIYNSDVSKLSSPLELAI